MATSEIEKLERRYAENPHGLTFAPLAEIHRKNGDIPRALELLRIGLELHPNYIPASIVLGRCHQDLDDLPAAEEAFSHVLRLDDENVIALKSLADINERQEKLEDAERWLRRLVSVDRSNEEARQQLQHLETLKLRSRRRAPPPPTPAPPVEAPPEVAISGPTPAPLESLDLTEELAGVGETTSQDQRPAPPEAAATQASPTSPPEPQEIEPVVSAAEKAEPEGQPPPVPGLVSAEFEPPKEAPKTLSPLGLEIETEEDVVLQSSGATEFSVPDATQDLLELAARLNQSRPRTPGRRATDRPAAEQRTAKPPTPPPPSEAEEPALIAPEPEPVAAVAPPPTVASEPPPALVPEPRPAVVPEPRPAVASGPQDAAPSRSYAARETKGQSIADFFQALLVARPPEDSPAPSSDSSGPVAGSIHPNQDGHPSTRDSAVSFDDFFGSGTKSSNALPSGSGEPTKDDLDQFQSWLQNLKR